MLFYSISLHQMETSDIDLKCWPIYQNQPRLPWTLLNKKKIIWLNLYSSVTFQAKFQTYSLINWQDLP